MKMDDALLGVISCTSRILSDLVYAFAVTDWQVYMGNVKKNYFVFNDLVHQNIVMTYRTLGSASRFSLRKEDRLIAGTGLILLFLLKGMHDTDVCQVS